MMLSSDEVEYEQIKQSRLFHFGTLSMTDDNVKEATKRAIETAKNNGLIISFDPNLRPPLWKSLDDARNQIAYGLSQCDVLKISDNEIEFMTGTSDFDKGANILMERYPNIKLLNNKQPVLMEAILIIEKLGHTYLHICLVEQLIQQVQAIHFVEVC